MRIIIVIHSLQLGGAERSAVSLAAHWVQKGYKVLVVTVSNSSVDYFKLDENIPRIELNLAVASMNGFQGIVANIKRIRILRKIIIDWKPDIVIGIMTISAILSILAGFGLPCKVIAAERTYPPRSELTAVWKWLRSKTYRYASAVLTQTQDGANWIRESLKTKKICVIPNSVTEYLPEISPHLSPDMYLLRTDKVLLAVGRLVPEKNYDLLIAASKNIFFNFQNWKLVIIGEGPERTKLEALIIELNLQKYILLPGRAGNISKWYSRCDIYVLTSHFEGFPNALIEAMAHGCAVISLDIKTGPSDLIEHGVNGLLIPDRKPETLGLALCYLMANNSLRATFSNKAKSVICRYSIESVSEKWDKLFSELLL